MADENRIFGGSVGKAAGRRNGGQDVEATRVSIFAGRRDLTENIKRPEGNNGDRDFGILKEFATRIGSCEGMLDVRLSCGPPRGLIPTRGMESVPAGLMS